MSGRADLNRRPHGPEPCTLAGLSYAPNRQDYNLTCSNPQAQSDAFLILSVAQHFLAST